MIVTEEKIRKIVSETLKKCLNENGTFQDLSKTNHGEIVSAGTLIKLSPEDVKKWANEIWNLFTISYENIGGIKTYKNFQDFLRKKNTAKIVVGTNNELLACATYRRMEDSFKMVAIGCNQTDEGKLALQQIIQNDITNYDLNYWAEVSGPIEHYFKKFNGFPIPNLMASTILEINPELITLSSSDEVHYIRPIGPENEPFQKMIFGFKSENDYYEVLKYIDNYQGFMNAVNNITEIQRKAKYSLNQCYYIVNNIYRLHEEDGYNELLPSWHAALIDCLYVFQNEEKTDTISSYIDEINYLLSDMQVIELHKLR